MVKEKLRARRRLGDQALTGISPAKLQYLLDVVEQRGHAVFAGEDEGRAEMARL